MAPAPGSVAAPGPGSRDDDISELSDGRKTVAQRLRDQPTWAIVLEVLAALAGLVGTAVAVYEVFFKVDAGGGVGGGGGGVEGTGAGLDSDCFVRTEERRTACNGGINCARTSTGGCTPGEREERSTSRDCRVDGDDTVCYHDVVCCAEAAPSPSAPLGWGTASPQTALPTQPAPRTTSRPTLRPTPRPSPSPIRPGATHWAPGGTDWSCVNQAGSTTCASMVTCVSDCADEIIVEYTEKCPTILAGCITDCARQEGKSQCLSDAVKFYFDPDEGFFRCS